MTAKLSPFPAWCRVHDIPTPTPEHRFHPERKWRLDWSWPDRKVAVEVHGSVWMQGRHTRGGGFLNDREKMNTAQAMGWKVFEVAASGTHPATLYSPELKQWLLETL